jgi:UDP-N-acetylmuramate--alanine ligase
MDADHLDIYGSHDSMEQAFEDFSLRLKPGGLLLLHLDLLNRKPWDAPRLMTYHLDNPTADIHTCNRVLEEGGYRFDLIFKGRIVKDVFLPMGGLHNIENVTAAIGLALDLGIEEHLIRSAVASFKGVKRRFEYIVRNEHRVLIDDYAHHPAELKALITGVRSLFENKKCLLIFQPHLFSRTKDFAKEFAAVLDSADETVLLPIYPARELPIEGISSDWLLGMMKNSRKHLLEKEALVDWLATKDLEETIVVMAGAGDIDRLVAPVGRLMEN